MENGKTQNAAELADATPKEKAIFFLKSLIELIEADRVRAESLQGLTVDEILALAEAEAQKVIDSTGAASRE